MFFKFRKSFIYVISIMVAAAIAFTGCSADSGDVGRYIDYIDKGIDIYKELNVDSNDVTTVDVDGYSLNADDIPEFAGEPFAVIGDNVPFFYEDELTDSSFEEYAELDSLGRCGPAVSSIGKDIMPTGKRGSIGSVKPSGWHTVKYDMVEGKYLYNRCHLIGYQLTAENANRKNLITGTRYLNTEGMLPFENMVADYIKETGNHVLYRVTPLFEGDELVARGVQMEAFSVEDSGEGICFNIFAYNVQPGVVINYSDGSSHAA